jgi:flagellar motor switch protein FliG
LDEFFPFKFDFLLKLDDRAIQKILREVDDEVLLPALRCANESVQKKIFNNMSKRAAQMLKEDMEYMGPVRLRDVIEAQKKILNLIRYLEYTGEIVIQYSKGEIV